MNKVIFKNGYNSKMLLFFMRHLKNNQKYYAIVCLVFFIGFIAGIILFNNSDNEAVSNVSEHIKTLANSLKVTENVDYIGNLKKSILINFILVLIIWIASSTIIGIPIVYAEIAFKGFSLSYTISSILITFGIKNGTIYSFSSLFLHSLISIPLLIATTVSGLKMYQTIIKRESVKMEFLRHTVFCLLMFILLIISSLIETYISVNLSRMALKFIKI